MRILVTFAVEAEFAPWRKLRDFIPGNNGLAEYHCARIGDADVNILLTGIGAKGAWLEATKVIWDGDIDVCVSSGLAGALRSDHKAGDILVATMANAPAWKKSVASDQYLVELAATGGARTVGAFLTADRVILTASEKQALGKIADAVEMESAEVLYEAAAFGAKVVAIRAVSDCAEEDLPVDFNRATTPAGEMSIPRILSEVARHPTSMPSLIRFGRQSRMAAARLCAFLDRYVEALVHSQLCVPKGEAIK